MLTAPQRVSSVLIPGFLVKVCGVMYVIFNISSTGCGTLLLPALVMGAAALLFVLWG